MLEWVRSRVRPHRTSTKGRSVRGCRRGSKFRLHWKQKDEVSGHADDAVLWTALALAFFYLLRACEYCSSGTPDLDKVLRGADVAFRKEGIPCSPGEADELAIQFRKQKADQLQFGATRSHYRTGGDVCVVDAVARLAEWFPERFGDGPEADLPLCRWEDGTMVDRVDILAALEDAAQAVGLPAARFKPHSLRIGGASALYHATGEIETVKRYGRWTSGAFHSYLWDSAEQAKGLAARMAADVATIHYT